MPLQTANQFQLTPDIIGSLSRGGQVGQQFQQIRQQPQIQLLRQQALQGDPQALQQLAAMDAPAAQQVQAFQQNRFNLATAEEKQKITSVARAALQVQAIPSTEGKIEFLEDRRLQLAEAGTKTQETDEALNLFKTGRVDEANQLVGQMVGIGEAIGVLKPVGAGRKATLRAFQPITLINRETGEKKLVSPTTDNITGQAALQPFDIPKGFEVSTETTEEKRAADVLAAGQKAKQTVTGKGQAGRRQLMIDRGLDAADSMANINRGIELLKQVKTGGIAAVSLKTKQIFGVEGADEAELSARLGKAVLSQLRTTFGAAFTEREGARLEGIEAGFGKSTAGNKRLLEQTKRIIERAAKRGIRAAEAEGDTESANDIREGLEFRLSVEPQTPPIAPQTAPTTPQVAPTEVIRFDRQGQRL